MSWDRNFVTQYAPAQELVLGPLAGDAMTQVVYIGCSPERRKAVCDAFFGRRKESGEKVDDEVTGCIYTHTQGEN